MLHTYHAQMVMLEHYRRVRKIGEEAHLRRVPDERATPRRVARGRRAGRRPMSDRRPLPDLRPEPRPPLGLSPSGP